ncbi:MAG TPA: YihY/virulence factor BrkB family protein [Candidatus Saccharimonadales bacterium]|nr:YihY/virulence factor BrkB family protein [Candidatus Saccharimonadales bacterium]
MNIITVVTQKLDAFQQRHPVVGFPYAVIKKFGDDNGGFQAALITYYGFLSLFPLLLVLVTVLHLVFNNNPAVEAQVSSSINTYFPMLGEQLQGSIQSMGKTGFGLAIGIIITLYGARGAADALRYALDNMWQIPKDKRAGFPKNILQSLSIIGMGAVGFAATIGASIITSSLGRAWWVKVVLNIVGFIILAGTTTVIFHLATARRISLKNVAIGATISALGVQLLLTFGSLLVAHQLKGLDALYGTFAIVLGLLFWIYLITQVVVYAAEIDTVRYHKLWPRGLDAKHPTAGDKKAYALAAKAAEYISQENIDVSFGGSKPKKGTPKDT